MALSFGEWLLPAKKRFCRTAVFAWLKQEYGQSSWFLQLKAYFEQNELDIALSRLRILCMQPDFLLADVAKILGAFSVSVDEREQLRWFSLASQKQLRLEEALAQEADIPALLKDFLVELGYLAAADNLYQRFGLVPLQQRIQQMIAQLTQRLDILIDLQKRQQQQQDLRLKLEREQQQLSAQQLETDKAQFERDKITEQCRLVELEMERHQSRIRLDESETARIKLEMQNRREAQAFEQMQQMQQAIASHQALGSLSS